MAPNNDIRGMRHPDPDYFIVGRGKIREFAVAIKDEDPPGTTEAATAELGYDRLARR